MHPTKPLLTLAAVLALGIHAANAQQVTTTPPPPTTVVVAPAPPPPGATATVTVAPTPLHVTTSSEAFERLSPGNRKVALSLFEAQSGRNRWSLDRIAAAKRSGEGWGQIFHQMRRDGLVHAKSLGQLVSRHERSEHLTLDRDHDHDHDRVRLAHHHHHDEVRVTTATGASHSVGHSGWQHGGAEAREVRTWQHSAGHHDNDHPSTVVTTTPTSTPAVTSGSLPRETTTAFAGHGSPHHK